MTVFFFGYMFIYVPIRIFIQRLEKMERSTALLQPFMLKPIRIYAKLLYYLRPSTYN